MRHLAVILPVTHLPARPVCPLPADGVRAGFHCPDTHHELGAASPHGVQAGIKANVVVIVTVTDVIEDTAGTAGLNAERLADVIAGKLPAQKQPPLGHGPVQGQGAQMADARGHVKPFMVALPAGNGPE